MGKKQSSVWKLIESLKDEEEGFVSETTSAMDVPGGVMLRVTTFSSFSDVDGAIALDFVPYACVVPHVAGRFRLESTMEGSMVGMMGTVMRAVKANEKG